MVNIRTLIEKNLLKRIGFFHNIFGSPVCICVCMCACVCITQRCTGKPEESVGCPGAGVTATHKLLNVGPGHPTWVSCKSSSKHP